MLTNPAQNYAQFLLRAILPTVLHVVVAISAGYAVGSEFSRRSLRAWLKAAGGSPLTALLGKFAPLFAIFILMMVADAGIVHGLFNVPFRGDSVLMGAAACLLVIAYLSLGGLFQLLTRNLALGMSVTAIICNPAFGFAGVGFPVLAMNGFARFWGSLLPLRWYIEILFDQAVRGLPPSSSIPPFMILGGLAVALFGLGWLRLGAIAAAPSAASRAAASRADTRYRGIGGAMVGRDSERILNDRGVFGLIVLAPIIYGLLYPQPYLGQLLRGIPIAAVDQDHTEVSRDLVQTLSADEAITSPSERITSPTPMRPWRDAQVFGIVDIPKDTEKEVLKGNRARVAAYVDFGLFSSLQPHAAGNLPKRPEPSALTSPSAEREPMAPSRTRL